MWLLILQNQIWQFLLQIQIFQFNFAILNFTVNFAVRSVILCGIETHACIHHTAIDLIERGIEVWLKGYSDLKLMWKLRCTFLLTAPLRVLPQIESLRYNVWDRFEFDVKVVFWSNPLRLEHSWQLPRQSSLGSPQMLLIPNSKAFRSL